MGAGHTILVLCFWGAAAGVVYAYLGYPVLIYLLSRLFGRSGEPRVIGAGRLPRVALLIVAHNEEAVIEQRIRNALALDYPPELLEVVIASDGSDDGTAVISRRFEGLVRTLDFPVRRGKAATLNDAIARLESEIIVLSDANTSMDADALRRLAGWFEDPGVGVVCGRLILSDPLTGRNVDSLYWRYETFLKTCEGRLGGLLGANGAIYAIRRGLFSPLPPGTMVDDFVIPLAARLRSGCRIVYDPRSIAREESAPDLRAEFGRRARIGAGGAQAMRFLWPLLSPSNGWTAFTFWSHKVMRWACPFFLIVMFAAALLLVRHPIYFAALMAQIVFYAVCGAAALLPPQHRACRPLRIFPLFASMNLALLVGFARALRGGHAGIWSRTIRVGSGAGPLATR